jgi:hypothetical protein
VAPTGFRVVTGVGNGDHAELLPTSSRLDFLTPWHSPPYKNPTHLPASLFSSFLTTTKHPPLRDITAMQSPETEASPLYEEIPSFEGPPPSFRSVLDASDFHGGRCEAYRSPAQRYHPYMTPKLFYQVIGSAHSPSACLLLTKLWQTEKQEGSMASSTVTSQSRSSLSDLSALVSHSVPFPSSNIHVHFQDSQHSLADH